MGVRPGVADLEIQWLPGQVGYLELKAPGKLTLRLEQRYWRGRMIEFGHRYEVADNLDRVVEILENWGAI